MVNKTIKSLLFWGVVLTGVVISVNFVFGAPITISGIKGLMYTWDSSSKTFSANTHFLAGAPTTTTGDKILSYCWNDTSKVWTGCTDPGTLTLNDLTDVTITAATYGDVLMYNGSAWVDTATSSLFTGLGSVTSVALTAPTGLTVSGSPITTSGTLALTYSGGYQGFTSYASSTIETIRDTYVDTETDPVWTGVSANYLLISNAFTQAIASTTFADKTLYVPYTGATTNLDLGLFNASSTQLTTTGSTYLATTAGNVGIRTTVPLGKLDVGGTGVVQVWSTSIAEVNRRNWGILREQSLVGDWQLAVSTAQGGAPATAVISATKEGNVGIGTTNPNYLLTVYGTASSTIVYAGTLIANTLTAPATFGGRSLTVNGNALDADAELYTDSITFQIASSSVATTSSQSAWQAPVALTITNVNGFCKQGTTTIALDERAETTPKTAGTDIFDDAWETGDYTSTTTFANASIAAGAWINIDVDGFVIGSPQHCRVSVEYTKND